MSSQLEASIERSIFKMATRSTDDASGAFIGSQYIISERESEEPSTLGDLSILNTWKQQVLPSLDVGGEGNLEVSMEESIMDWQLALIEEVKTFPCIWNTKARGFKEAPRKQVAWKMISQHLNMEGRPLRLDQCSRSIE